MLYMVPSILLLFVAELVGVTTFYPATVQGKSIHILNRKNKNKTNK